MTATKNAKNDLRNTIEALLIERGAFASDLCDALTEKVWKQNRNVLLGGKGCALYIERNRETGTESWAGRALESGLETADWKANPWAAQCWTHSTLIQTTSKALAIIYARNPAHFCDDCRTNGYTHN